MRKNPLVALESDVVFVDAPESAERAVEPVATRQIGYQRPSERPLVGMSGRYSLQSWRDADGNPRVFDCTVVRMASRGIELAVPVTGAVGEWVSVHFDKFGRFEGPVIKIAQRSLVMRIVATFEETQKIADQIAEAESLDAGDTQEHERFVPAGPRSTVMLPNGSRIPCQIIDYSASGITISSSLEPELGLVVKIGKVIGRVVDQFDGGFAVRFAVLQDPESLEARLKPNL
jgi:hypothetical protein